MFGGGLGSKHQRGGYDTIRPDQTSLVLHSQLGGYDTIRPAQICLVLHSLHGKSIICYQYYSKNALFFLCGTAAHDQTFQHVIETLTLYVQEGDQPVSSSWGIFSIERSPDSTRSCSSTRIVSRSCARVRTFHSFPKPLYPLPEKRRHGNTHNHSFRGSPNFYIRYTSAKTQPDINPNPNILEGSGVGKSGRAAPPRISEAFIKKNSNQLDSSGVALHECFSQGGAAFRASPIFVSLGRVCVRVDHDCPRNKSENKK